MSQTLHVLESFTRSNLEFNESILIGCFFQECRLEVKDTELWYCTFEDSWINLDGFTELWKDIWHKYLNRLSLFITEYENSSGLCLVSIVQKYVEISDEQLKLIKTWQPLFCTCEGRLNCCHPKRLITAESKAMAEAIALTERKLTGEEYDFGNDEYDYDDDED